MLSGKHPPMFFRSSADDFMNRDKNVWELDLLLYRSVAYYVCTTVWCWWRVDSVLYCEWENPHWIILLFYLYYVLNTVIINTYLKTFSLEKTVLTKLSERIDINIKKTCWYLHKIFCICSLYRGYGRVHLEGTFRDT